MSNKLIIAGFAIAAIMFAALFILWHLLSEQTAATADAQHQPVWATRDLPAFYKLTAADLKERDKSKGAAKDFVDRLLLNDVKEGEEVTAAALATPDASGLLKDIRQVAIPANTDTTLGGRLRVGDMVELRPLPVTKNAAAGTSGQGQPAGLIENLFVVSVPAGNVPPAPTPTPVEKPDANKAQTNPAASATAAPTAAAAAAPKENKAAPAAVIVLALDKDKIEDLLAAIGGSKWTLTRKSHASIYRK